MVALIFLRIVGIDAAAEFSSVAELSPICTDPKLDRERQARVILGDAEVQVSEQFAKASQVYSENPVALHLRGMNMLFEAMRDKGSMVVVPSSAIETMGLGGTLAATAIAKQ